jgi:hypothetical protein
MYHADIQIDFGNLAQNRLGISGHADNSDSGALEQRQQSDNFIGCAGIGDGQDDVVFGDHAQVAVAGFTRVDEK